eukprot:57831-Prymnesium_polylepis.2
MNGGTSWVDERPGQPQRNHFLLRHAVESLLCTWKETDGHDGKGDRTFLCPPGMGCQRAARDGAAGHTVPGNLGGWRSEQASHIKRCALTHAPSWRQQSLRGGTGSRQDCRRLKEGASGALAIVHVERGSGLDEPYRFGRAARGVAGGPAEDDAGTREGHEVGCAQCEARSGSLARVGGCAVDGGREAARDRLGGDRGAAARPLGGCREKPLVRPQGEEQQR